MPGSSVKLLLRTGKDVFLPFLSLAEAGPSGSCEDHRLMVHATKNRLFQRLDDRIGDLLRPVAGKTQNRVGDRAVGEAEKRLVPAGIHVDSKNRRQGLADLFHVPIPDEAVDQGIGRRLADTPDRKVRNGCRYIPIAFSSETSYGKIHVPLLSICHFITSKKLERLVPKYDIQAENQPVG